MKIACLFPGQGAQYPNMGKDFVENYSEAKRTFEEADDLLKKDLSSLILQGSKSALKETENCQLAIFVVSVAIFRVIERLFSPFACFLGSGLSLGEYTAISTAGYLSFKEALLLVQKRGRYMQEACQKVQGAMAAIIGLKLDQVEELIRSLGAQNELWVANLNCPGQIVLSGTAKAIEKVLSEAKKRGAKMAIPLQVAGAFHSPLMKEAKERLREPLLQASFQESPIPIMMNVTAQATSDLSQIKSNLIEQVVSPVRWEEGVRHMEEMGTELFLEVGCGKVLQGFNKRIGVQAKTVSVEKVEDLPLLERSLDR